MQITFDPTNPGEVRRMFELLRVLNMIDPQVNITVNEDETMSSSEARKFIKELEGIYGTRSYSAPPPRPYEPPPAIRPVNVSAEDILKDISL